MTTPKLIHKAPVIGWHFARWQRAPELETNWQVWFRCRRCQLTAHRSVFNFLP